MSFYTDDFLDEKRYWWLDSFRRVQAYTNSTWYDGEIQKKEVDDTDILIHAVFSSLDEVACTITLIRILDRNGTVVGTKAVNITKSATQSTLFRFTFPFIEVTS